MDEYSQCPGCYSFNYVSEQSAETENRAYFDATFATLDERKVHRLKQSLFQHYTRVDQQRRRRQYAQYWGKRRQIMTQLEGQRKILEIGFGAGTHLAGLLQRGNDAYGIDLSATAVKRFQEKYPRYSDRVYVGSQFSKSVEMVYCCALFEHLDTPEQFLQNAESCLQPGGTLILDGLPLVSEMQADFGPEEDINFWKPCHRAIYSLAGLRTLLEKHGFTLEASAMYDDYNYRVASVHLRAGYHEIAQLRNSCLADRSLPGIFRYNALCRQALSVHSLAYLGTVLARKQ